MSPYAYRHLQEFEHLYRVAEARQYIENPIYALFNSISSALIKALKPPASHFVYTYPQIRLVPHKLALEQAINKIRDATPDFCLTLASVVDNDGQDERVLSLVEIKRLCQVRFPNQSIPSQIIGLDDGDVPAGDPVSWDKGDGLYIAESTFTGSIAQILIQAFCAFHYFKQSDIYHIFICGNYFWLLEFKRPTNLLGIEAIQNYNLRDSSEVAKLIPKDDRPRILFSGKGIFNNPTENIALSRAWVSALKIVTHVHGVDSDGDESDLFDFKSVDSWDSEKHVANGPDAFEVWYSKYDNPPTTPDRPLQVPRDHPLSTQPHNDGGSVIDDMLPTVATQAQASSTGSQLRIRRQHYYEESPARDENTNEIIMPPPESPGYQEGNRIIKTLKKRRREED